MSAARDGEWDELEAKLDEGVTVDALNTVPPGRTWGVVHQVAYWGDAPTLDKLCGRYPGLNLELETSEDAAQVPADIAQGRGHAAFVASLRERLGAQQKLSGGRCARPSASPVPSEWCLLPPRLAGFSLAGGFGRFVVRQQERGVGRRRHEGARGRRRQVV